MNKDIVKKINELITSQLWLDFEVVEYTISKLTIIGSISPSYPADIEITFTDIFCMSLPMMWQTDTQQEVFKIAENEEARIINKKFKIEYGYTPFLFIPEDYPEDFYCIIAAKSVNYEILNIGLFKTVEST